MSATAEKEGSKLTRGLNLTSARWQTLGVLYWSQERLTVSQVARSMGLRKQSVQELVNEMERDGLISFEPNPSDRRTMFVVLTKLGDERHKQALEREWKWTNAIVRGVDAEQIEQAVATIALLTAKMEADS